MGLFRVSSSFPAVPFHLEGTGLILRSRHPCWMPQTSHAQSGTPPHPPQMLPKLSKYWIYHRREHIWLINSLFPNWSHSDKDLKCTPIVSGYCFQLHMLLPATMQSVHFMLVCKSCSHQTIDSQYLNWNHLLSHLPCTAGSSRLTQRRACGAVHKTSMNERSLFLLNVLQLMGRWTSLSGKDNSQCSQHTKSWTNSSSTLHLKTIQGFRSGVTCLQWINPWRASKKDFMVSPLSWGKLKRSFYSSFPHLGKVKER